MSNKTKGILIFGIVFIALWIVIRVTGAISFFTVPTPSNEPSIKMGSFIIATNLKKPGNGDFICYNTPEQGQKVVYVKRLCGMPGDKIEMRKGIFYLNGENFDEVLNLNHRYVITRATLVRLQREKKADDSGLDLQGEPDSVIVFIEDKVARGEPSTFHRLIMPESARIPDEEFIFKQGGNMDNFGPLIVPVDSYFVMGDNRENSVDSRITGYVPEENWIGTVLGK